MSNASLVKLIMSDKIKMHLACLFFAAHLKAINITDVFVFCSHREMVR